MCDPFPGCQLQPHDDHSLLRGHQLHQVYIQQGRFERAPKEEDRPTQRQVATGRAIQDRQEQVVLQQAPVLKLSHHPSRCPVLNTALCENYYWYSRICESGNEE